MKFNENTHPSYIKAAIEVCRNIVADPPELKKEFNDYQKEERLKMIKFAEDFLIKFDK